MIPGTHIIREPFIEAHCEPLPKGGWRVTSVRGTSEHPAAGDPYVALDRHIAATSPRPMESPTARLLLLRAHGRREHVEHPRLDCPACRKFAGTGRREPAS